MPWHVHARLGGEKEYEKEKEKEPAIHTAKKPPPF
jgi:hypothetical protein